MNGIKESDEAMKDINISNNFTRQWDWSLNDILVFSSLVIFLLVVCSCSFMWMTRPGQKKQLVDVSQRTLPVREILQNRGSSLDSNGRKLKDKKKSKKKKKDNEEDSIQSSSTSEDNESLLGGRLAGN